MSNTVEELSRLSRPSNQGLLAYLSIPGLSSLGVGAALYLYSLHTGKKSYDLDRVQQVVKLEDLKVLAHLLPTLVAIRGRVNSHGPKKCELCDKQAVIHEVVEEEVWRKQRAEGRTVYEPFETRKVFEECEWYLEDGSGLRVRVENALQAERLRSAMHTKTEFVAEDLSSRTITKVLIEKAWQMTKHGVRKTERYLPVGSVVTCVGELDANHIRTQPAVASSISGSSSRSGGTGPDSSGGVNTPSTLGTSSSSSSISSSSGQTGSTGAAGSGVVGGLPVLGKLGSLVSGFGGGGGTVNEDMPYVLRKPAGGPSYITPLTLDQLKSTLSSTARNCRWLAYAFGAVGVALLLRKATQRWLQRLHERRIRHRVAQAEAARKARQAEARKARQAGVGGSTPAGEVAGSAASGAGEEEEYQGDRAAGTCVICLEEPVEMVFTSCGHMCCCMSCGISLDRCPICRIKGRAIKVYKP